MIKDRRFYPCGETYFPADKAIPTQPRRASDGNSDRHFLLVVLATAIFQPESPAHRQCPCHADSPAIG